MAPVTEKTSKRRRFPVHAQQVAQFSALILFGTLLHVLYFSRPHDFAAIMMDVRPLKPRKLVVAFSPNVQNGLGAQVLHMLDAAAFARLGGPQSHLCVRESRYWNYGCAPNKGWSCYFSSPPCSSSQICPELARLPPRTVWSSRCVLVSSQKSMHHVSTVASRLAAQHPVSELAFYRHVVSSLWKPNSKTSKAMTKIFKRLGLEPRHYVAVHIRRGDKRREVPLTSLKKYARAIRIMARLNEPIFIATDDGSVLYDMRKRLPDRIIKMLPSATKRVGHLQAEQNRVWMKRRYEDVVDLMAEIELMRKARIFIGTFSSNLGRLVYVLRNTDERDSVSLDDRWSPGVAWKTFGKPYCSWKRSNKTFCETMRKMSRKPLFFY